jgi:tRNA modification GTPase
MARPTDTIAALATPGGASALAVVRITGCDTGPIAAALLGSPPPPRTASRGDYRDLGGAVLDEALFTFFPGPRSYTGEDLLEVSCHGNPFIVQRILGDLFARGCRPAEPGEFTRRAFLNGRLDLSQAEAVMDVIHARGERALAAAQRQLRGALGTHLRGLTDDLLGALARIEAHIDFPEEDIPPEDAAGLRAVLGAALAGTARLLATRRYGALLRDGVRTVIIGEPNAGKSSLLNRLVGRERAIVSPEPGTTRDFIEERVIVGAHCLRLIDTAGLNPGATGLEALGVAQTRERIEESDILVLVLDAARPSPPLPAGLAARLGPGNAVVALNKTDLLRGPPAAAAPAGVPCVPVSALTGEGIGSLLEAITRQADGFRQAVGDDAIAINARHAQALERARDCLSEGLAKLAGATAPLELLASDLRGALDAFGEISGKIDNERMLDRLFATFCIGK